MSSTEIVGVLEVVEAVVILDLFIIIMVILPDITDDVKKYFRMIITSLLRQTVSCLLAEASGC